MLTRMLSLLLLLFFVASPVLADDAAAVKKLEALLSDLDTLKADFTQTVLNDELEPVRESSGSFLLQRAGKGMAGKFRWDYTAPFEQTIVGDGVNLWTYDPELEQATVKPMQETLASSPASLLTGASPIEDDFMIREIGQSGALYWIELRPRVQDTDFQRVRVAIGAGEQGGELDTMELLDALGQTTRIRFEHVERNAHLEDDAFYFAPPEGADVIGEPVDR